MTIRSLTATLAGVALVLAVAGVFVASAGARADAAQHGPNALPAADPSAPPKADADDEESVTVTGEVGTTTVSGEVEYQITVGGQATRLSVGPKWFNGSDPLAQFVGKTATVTGERSTGKPSPNASPNAKAKPDEGPEIDVFTISSGGTTVTIRGAGKPPWAGGPKAVGTAHPGSKHSKTK